MFIIYKPHRVFIAAFVWACGGYMVTYGAIYKVDGPPIYGLILFGAVILYVASVIACIALARLLCCVLIFFQH